MHDLSRRIIISANTSWNLINFRSGLITGLRQAGFQVVAVAPPDKHSHLLATLGCEFVPLEMENHGTSIARDLALLLRYISIIRTVKPAAYLGYTIKPNVYGSMAARLAGIPVLNNIAGLGVAFSNKSVLRHIAVNLYRLSLRNSARVFFQNDEDRQFFIDHGLAQEGRTAVLPGSGIDLVRFAPSPQDGSGSNCTVFLLVARLLWEKGIGEYVAAARSIRASGSRARFQLLGFLEEGSPAAISRATLEEWIQEGIIDYLGTTSDVRPHLSASDCVVLPSYYREGTPRSLLEAAAMGKPIITTDWVGCRNVVDHDRNGFLCQPRSADDLRQKMMEFMTLANPRKRAMGQASREKAVLEFDEQIVIAKYMQALREIGIHP